MKRAKDYSKKAGTAAKGAETKAVRTENALELVNNIITNERVAEEFFFKTMLPKMAALADSYNRSFGLDILAEDVAKATYLSCWEDDWAKLKAFKGDTTPHAWVAKIASQATYQFLVEERYIDGVGNTKTNDYRLTVRSIENDQLRQAIVDLVFVPDQHKALELFYVDKMPDKEFFKAFDNEEKAKETLKVAEKTLIEQLLNTENPYAEMALSSKKTINLEVRFQNWHDRIDEGDVSENHQAFRDLLVRLFKCEDWDENVNTLINTIITSLDWTEVQEDVWRQRFIYETPSKELAEKYQVRNTWVDNVFSRLNKQFRIAIKSWWDNNNR